MAVYRVEKNDNFTMLSNHLFKDYSLTWKAKGMLSNMLSLPEDWDYSAKGLSKLTSDGIESTRSGLKELEEHGYLARRPIKKNGKIVDWEYDIFEVPRMKESDEENPDAEKLDVEKPDEENPDVGKPDVGEADTENQTQLSTNLSIPKESKTEGSRTNVLNASKEAVVYYPLDDELNSVLLEYIEHRKRSKRSMTENMIHMLMEKLDEMAPDNKGKIEILKQSLINGWIGIDYLKEEKEKKQQKKGSAANDFVEISNEFADEEGGFFI